jgi:hypothetical protein
VGLPAEADGPGDGKLGEFDANFLNAEASESLGSGYNNCIHYKVDGMLTAQPPFEQDSDGNMVIHGRKYPRPIFVTPTSTTADTGVYYKRPASGNGYWHYACARVSKWNLVGSSGGSWSFQARYYIMYSDGSNKAEIERICDRERARTDIPYDNRLSITVSKATHQASGYTNVYVEARDIDPLLFKAYRYFSPSIDEIEWLEDRTDAVLPFGTLTLQAAQSARRLDVNALMLAKDLVDTPHLIEDLADSAINIADALMDGRQLNKVSDLKRELKPYASFYLANHYGTRLSAKDVSEAEDANVMLAQSAANYCDRELPDFRQTYSKTQYMGANGSAKVGDTGLWKEITCERRVTMIVDTMSDEGVHAYDTVEQSTNAFVTGIQRYLYEYDWIPSFSNIWDAVPWSFVVDWFLPIGDVFEKQEQRSYVETLPIRRVFNSSKWQMTERVKCCTGSVEWTGSLHITLYKRDCLGSPVAPVYIDASDLPPHSSPFDHIVEGAALLVQVLN